MSEYRDNTILALMSRLGFPMANLNYRLSPEVQHPAHAQDVIDGLKFVRNWRKDAYDIDRIILVGQSCGSFLVAQCALLPPLQSKLKVPAEIQNSIKAVACIESITDLYELTQEYLQYADFVHSAFGTGDENLKIESITNWKLNTSNPINWLIIHSREDELVTPRQSILLAEALIKSIQPEDYEKVKNIPKEVESKGEQTVARSVTGKYGRVELDLDTCHGKLLYSSIAHTKLCLNCHRTS